MSISIHLHKIYRQYCNGAETVEVEGDTVEECLHNLTEMFPDVEKAVFTAKGQLHPLVEIYLNSSSAYPDALKKTVEDGDKLYLIHTLAGG